MGFKNAAQRKAVWASKNEQKKGSPAKQRKKRTLLGAEYEVKDGDRASLLAQAGRNLKANAKLVGTPVGRAVEKGKKLLHGVGDFLKKTQETAKTGGPKFTNLGRPPGNWMIPPKNQVVKDSPMNHCASDMMHSGGWKEMRKHNSPGTIGNKAGIKHNEKMRQEIGTFKMPHSPLNKGHEVKKDSLGEDEAWAQWEKGYMDRTHKFKGTKFERPLTAEENRKEMEAERNEFKYDDKTGRIRLKKRDDADQPIERKSSPMHKEGKKDACYHKVKSRVKVWPSAYASGQLVQCRKAGAANWGNKSKKK